MGRAFRLSLVTISLSVVAFAAVLIFELQGKIFTTATKIPGTDDYDFHVYIIDGVRVNSAIFGRFYNNNAEPFITPRSQINIAYLDSEGVSEKRFALVGRNIADYQVARVLSYEDGRFKLLPNVSEWGSESLSFHAQSLLFFNFDKDKGQEIAEQNYIGYIDAPGQVWKAYYKWDDKNQIYKFVRETKTEID